ncbi:MAG: beta-propeller domain-containing protein, partial [Nitrososphaerales archaeon]
ADRAVFEVTDPDQSGRESASFIRSVPAAPSSQIVEQSDSAIVDFSTTNVQVSNVDEPDFLKNDGKYAYILSNDKLTIVEAYPAEDAKVILKVGLDVQGQFLQNMFLNEDRLVIFYQGQGEEYTIQEYDYIPRPIYSQKTHALVLDVSDKENPKTIKNFEVDGYYHSARMVNDHVYFIVNNGIDYQYPIIPGIMESSERIMSPDVYYFDNPEQYYTFNTVAALNIFGDEINAETFMMSSASTIYVSEDSIYITYMKNLPYDFYRMNNKAKFFDVILPLLPDSVQNEIKAIANSDLDSNEKWNRISDLLEETYNKMPETEKNRLFEKIQKALEEYESKIQQETQKTIVHKIGMDRLVLNYVSKGEVPGRLLNQFSMDEYNDRFRIATTSEFYTSKGNVLHNNVYVLDKTLKIVGSLEKIAPDESIYSARFMGNKLYLVTFQRIDPFFVIDLSTDTPKVLGELKIPGYSTYLHPYDENHIIGIGRETKENQWGGVQNMGVKVALFDVSDVRNPRAVDVFTIGDESTDSELLHDHKAMLFDKEKNILSIPVQGNIHTIRPLEEPARKDVYLHWRGFYVFGIDIDDGITLREKIEHSRGDYDYGYGSRSFYIGDVLYTVTSNLMKMNDLNDMSEVG